MPIFFPVLPKNTNGIRKECFILAMSWCISGMLVLSLLFGLARGTLPAVAAAAFSGADSAVRLCFSMLGTLCLWNGVMEVLRASRVDKKIARAFRPLLRRLLPRAAQDPETLAAVSANLSANLLGLGNAATPLGIQAAKRMAAGCHGTASDELCLLVVLNTASIQLLPSTIAAVRSAAGCADPFDILPAVWVSSLLSVTVGITAARCLARWRRAGR